MGASTGINQSNLLGEGKVTLVLTGIFSYSQTEPGNV